MSTSLVLEDLATGLRLGPLPDEVRLGSSRGCGVVLAPSLGAPPLAIVLQRANETSFRLRLPGTSPHPCRIVHDERPRPARAEDTLALGDVLVVTGSHVDLQLRLTEDDPRPMPMATEQVAPGTSSSDRRRLLAALGAGGLLLAVALLALSVAILTR